MTASLNYIKILKYIFFLLSLVFCYSLAFGFDKECSYDTLMSKHFIENSNVFDKEARQGTIIGHNVNIFKKENGNSKVSLVKLNFGDLVQIIDPGSRGGKRIKVAEALVPEDEIGWINRDELLCKFYPERDQQTGLWRRVFIQTTEKILGKDNNSAEPVKLYQSSNGECLESGCGQVTLYKWFFVYGERNGKVLLSEYSKVHESTQQMAGWLDDNEGIAWNTASALRPGSKDYRNDNREDSLCLWNSEQESNNNANCKGKTYLGKVWFKSDQRLAIIDETDSAWQVVFNGNSCTEDMKTCEENFLNLPNTNALEQLKNVDVMFVIDGTKSIAPVIDSIKGTSDKPGLIKQMKKEFSSKLSQGINIRVGFRIYRDSQKGGKDDGVRKAENLSLQKASCDSNRLRKFDKEFKKVTAGDKFKDNDLEENFYGGILQGIKDLRSCEGHFKIMFVIGDHGYSCEAQKKKGWNRCHTIDKIVKEMIDNSTIPIIPLFIQLPKETDPKNITDQGRLDRAYSLFENQAKDILSLYAGEIAKLRELDSSEKKEIIKDVNSVNFLRLPKYELEKVAAGELVRSLDQFINPGYIFGALNKARTGKNLNDAFYADKERGNVPAIISEAILSGICGDDNENKQCEDDIIQKVSQVWVSKNDEDKVVKEILMTDSQLDDWRQIIEIMEDVGGGIEGRSEAPSIIIGRTASSLGINIDSSRSIRNPNEAATIGELIQSQGGLPGGFDSPLFNYSLDEIRNSELMPLCIFNRFVKGTISRKRIINKLLTGTLYPFYNLESDQLFKLQCEGKVSDEKFQKALDISIVKPDSLEFEDLNQAGGIEEFKYSHSNLGSTFVWVPVDFLP